MLRATDFHIFQSTTRTNPRRSAKRDRYGAFKLKPSEARFQLVYIIIDSYLSVCPLSPLKWRDIRWRNFACRHVSPLCRTFVRSYVDRGHRWEKNEHRKTVLTLLLLWLNGHSHLLLYID